MKARGPEAPSDDELNTVAAIVAEPPAPTPFLPATGIDSFELVLLHPPSVLPPPNHARHSAAPPAEPCVGLSYADGDGGGGEEREYIDLGAGRGRCGRSTAGCGSYWKPPQYPSTCKLQIREAMWYLLEIV
jgi:hypothetical protein